MISKKRKASYKKSISVWGEGLQCLMFFEESSELGILLSKYLRDKHPSRIEIAEEIADCKIILEQLSVLFDVEKNVDDFEKIKLKRLVEMAIDSEAQQRLTR